MSRRRNLNVPGHAHELTFSCDHGYQFLGTDRTCNWLAEALDEARRDWDFALWAYVFMPEHVHLIVSPRRLVYDIADIRQAIKEPAARQAIAFLESQGSDWLERISVLKGGRTRRYFWQPGGGYDRNIEEPRTSMSMIEYIHMNPVRRGLVQRAVDWKWSSAGWFFDRRLSPVAVDPIPPEWIP